MHDRVAEILSQRAALDSGKAAGVLLSILLHGGLTALALYVALHQPPPQLANVLNIKFAPARSAGTAVIKRSPAAAKPVTPRIESPKPEAAQPARTTPEKNTVPFSPFGRSPKKGSEAPETRKPAPEPATAGTAIADVPVGGTGVAGLEGGDFPYTLYIERMKILIGSHWFRPQVSGSTTTTVYFAIERDGTIRDVRSETASGNSIYDRAALRAVLETSPLPPLPFGYSGTYLGVHLTFR